MQEQCDTGRGSDAEKEKRETAASMVISMLEGTAGRAEKVVCTLTEKTNSITRKEPPSTSTQGIQNPAVPREEYPPLFDRQRELIESINRSLDGIEDIMRRCEL